MKRCKRKCSWELAVHELVVTGTHDSAFVKLYLGKSVMEATPPKFSTTNEENVSVVGTDKKAQFSGGLGGGGRPQHVPPLWTKISLIS